MRDKRIVCERKKLYKSGKMLVTAGIFSLAIFGATVTDVSADTTHTDNATLVAANDPVKAQEQGSTHDDAVANDKATVTPVTESAKTDAATDDKTADTPIAEPAKADVTAVDKKATEPVTEPAKTEAATDDKTAATSAVEPATTNTGTTQPVTEPAKIETPTATVDKNVPAASTKTSDATVYKANDKVTTDQSTVEPSTSQSNSSNASTASDKKETSQVQQLDKIESDSPNIKQIDGKTYFVGDDGQVKKNFTAVVDGQVLYFDKTTGELTSNDRQYADGLTNIDNEHNAAYSLTADSFTNVDGYLTANSWYRPKEILKSGTTWTPSAATDFRPLLMSWWPDKDTQVAYLKYMQSVGLLEDDVAISNSTQTADLTNSAMSVQKNIEQKISLSGNSTDWLKTDMTQWVNSQPNWNISSESKSNDHLQGGALLYVNSDKTPDANSDDRLLNRTPINQNGQITDSSQQGGYEMLLANDVDNSNPVVQAEQLNWLYYMMNIGTITQNDPTGNFDGYRVDAVDNVDADLLQIASDYFKAAYKTNQSDSQANSHISILEDWEAKDAAYIKAHGNNQLTMDFPIHLGLKYALNVPVDQRSGLESTITNSLVNRTEDSTENTAQPNYSFIRAHDSEVQTVIAQIVKDKINPNSDGLTVTPDEIKKAFEIYNVDELKADKEYTAYNIPSSYALLLTNKDTVPRVYYGDLYTDDGQYMAKQSPYYDAITSLLKSRVKYVSGGQSMGTTYLHDNQGVLTSVRYGTGSTNATDTGNADTRTSGIGLVISNQPDLNLNQNEQVVLNMGAAHKNQDYRALMLSTKDGLQIYNDDAGAPVVRTNDLGQLIFKSDLVQGINDPQVSGYLAAWVPVGASANQDVRTASSTETSTDGSTYHSNAALDSQVIYEGFSNFQAMPTNADEYTNVKIAQNASLFKDLGITTFELAPQYRSSTDQSFLDSVVQNGYAFTDRYDIGYNTPTKYGTAEQLVDSLRALHAQGIQAINDWVPDQIYNLPGEQIVTATRTNSSGKDDDDSVINHTLYDSSTIGGGQYQAQYGGAFLDQLKADYPTLFETKQISTGKPMNPDVKITEWSAKYFNGSNIQGRGAWYVLKDWATNQYFNVSSDNDFLPKQLLGEKTSTGFTTNESGQTAFYSTSGYQAKNTFIQDNNNWYYFDNDGYMVVGSQEINGRKYYFLPNGVELQDAYLSDGQNQYYYNKTGKAVVNQYYLGSDNNWRYFFADGHMALGLTTITADNGSTSEQYFDQNGVQVKGTAIRDDKGDLRYFDAQTGNLLTNTWQELPNQSWIYLDDQGIAVTNKQEINGQTVYFNYDGKQVKNDFKRLENNGQWLYLNDQGDALTGEQNVAGQELYFNSNGEQVKNDQVKNSDGTISYYDGHTGDKLRNDFGELPDGSWLYLNNDGHAVTGEQKINGQTLYFNDNGVQLKGGTHIDETGKLHYYDVNSGDMVTNQFVTIDGKQVYFDNDGNAVD
ncbi:glycoside hydrolase family 70 protein [Leuconostoc kimchii]|uniref:dextransucrase n=1 Tax=Leuconostoc kimchii TaxID=136609 RepID=A0ABX5SLF3_9LACO|nr:glycoside hydrolase family 70 protein [Leuconostoc kimchii]QBR47883.1 glucosyltransferase [Leuconostoc kimchii]